ncbi:MAG: hypothetical protein WKG07_37645 [Hymenobacter sp.]
MLFTPAALDEEYGQQILARATALDLDIELLKSNRLTGLRGDDERATYRTAKTTLAVVNAPAGALRLQPTRPRPTISSTSPKAAPPTASTATWPAASAARPWCAPSPTCPNCWTTPRPTSAPTAP